MPAKNKITPRALMELKMPGDVQISPDSRRVAFSVSETDWDENRVSQHLYVVMADGETPARQVTRGPSEESEPRWSPDGKWLAFLTARDEAGDAASDFEEEDEAAKTQVWLLPMDGLGGEAEKWTDAPEGVVAYEWLPDGTGIVYLAREPRPGPVQQARADRRERKDDALVEREEKFRQQLWRIGLEDKKAKLIYAGDLGIGELAVSPDGRWVAYTTNYTGEDNDYHLVDVWTLELATGAVQQLTSGPGGKFHPVWAFDSQSVFFTTTLDPALSFSQENLYAVRLADRSRAALTEDFPHDLTGWRSVWTDATGMIYVAAAVGTTTGIYRRSPDNAQFEGVVQEEAHIHDFHVAPDGSMAYVTSSAGDVPELLWLAPRAAKAIALTDLNADWAGRYQTAPTEAISYVSTEGWDIEALLTLPLGYEEGQTYPLLVNLHGGPHGRMVQALTPFTVAQVWAAEGYAVLSPNYRGSEGYGDAFGTASRADLGGGDARDVMAGVDWAIREGIADPAKLGIIGSSYGAYLVNWLLTQTQRFGAAISLFGIFSLVTDFSNSQAPRWDTEYLGGFPWEQPELYARLSPANQVGQVQTPVLIMHGEGDGNTFIANSQEMYQALRLLGRPVEFVRYPREGHGFFEPQHRLDEMRRTLGWFDRYVRDGGTRAAYRIGDRQTQDGWELMVVEIVLATYAGLESKRTRFLEVVVSLRDAAEQRRSLTLRPEDFRLTRVGAARSVVPLGIPVSVLGGKALAAGRGWKYEFAASPEERGLAVALAVTFSVGLRSGDYRLGVKEFAPIVFHVPAQEKSEAP